MKNRKNWKKLAALFLTLTMVFGLAACGSFETRMVRAAQKMEKTESMHMDMDMDIDMHLALLGENLDTDVKMSGAMDMHKEPLLAKMDMTVDALGQTVDVTEYMEKNGTQLDMYLKDSITGSWSKQTVDMDEAPGQLNMTEQFVVFKECAKDFSEVGQETVNGSQATRYDGVIRGEYIEAAVKASGALDALSESLEMDLDEDDFANLGSLPTSLWIDDKSGMIVRYDMDMTEIMQSVMTRAMEDALDQAGLGSVDLSGVELNLEKVTVSVVLSQFDQIGEIVIPEEAKNS